MPTHVISPKSVTKPIWLPGNSGVFGDACGQARFDRFSSVNGNRNNSQFPGFAEYVMAASDAFERPTSLLQ